jgi:tryptophan-rich sensory protein
MSKGEWIALAVFLAVCFGVAALGSLATTPEIPTWYSRINKPSWTPPNWLFGPVWTALYAAMAVAAWLVWKQGGWRDNRAALILFAVQLSLNLAWSFIFFKFHQTGWAFLEIVLLWLAIAATLIVFAKSSKTASILMAPYLAWVTYAAALNYSIWRSNS